MFSRPLKILFAAILLSVTIIIFPLVLRPVFADEIDDLQKQIDSLNHARELSENATKPLEGQLSSLQVQLKNIEASLESLSSKITQKQNDLDAQKQKLTELLAVFNDRVERDYKSGYTSDTFSLIFGSNGKFSDKLYGLITINNNKKVIDQISEQAATLANQAAQLEKEKQQLASFQAQVDQNATFLNGEITKAKAYQADLSNQISALSAKQQALIAAKLASLNIPQSAYAGIGKGCVDDRGVDPGFSPRFAFFTYGVPNRVGLNQYGAKGRAEAGQSYDTILNAYYQNYSLTDAGNPNIHVVGTNNYGENIDMTLSLEDYLKHIYEMPASWAHEALKAQAVAARSYVLAATNNGANSICPSDSCQEFKSELNDGNWQSAVDDTKGKVMSSGGSPIKAWFSSTHGGYVHSSGDIGWSGTSYTKTAQDTSSSVSSFSDLQNNAYDKGSPWFYCDWGSRGQYSNTAWLKPDEVADIVNVMLLAQKDSSTVTHLTQVDKPNPDGVDTWDSGRVRQELQSRGATPFNNVSDISVNWDTGSGKVTSVSVSGDGGGVSFDGTTFKQYFDLRAPANIQIVGPLFNVEKR